MYLESWGSNKLYLCSSKWKSIHGSRTRSKRWSTPFSQLQLRPQLSVSGDTYAHFHVKEGLEGVDKTFCDKGHFTHETESLRPLHFKHSRWWKRWSRSKYTSHYARGTKRSMWMQDGFKVYMDSYMASNGSCSMVTWTIFKNHFLNVGLTPNQEIMALRTLTTVDLFYCIIYEDPHE